MRMLNQNTELYSVCVGAFWLASATLKPLSCKAVATRANTLIMAIIP